MLILAARPALTRPKAAAFSALGATFDGTNDFGARGADLTGNADSKVGTISFWFWLDSNAADENIRATTAGDMRVEFLTATASIQVRAENAAGTVILAVRADPAGGISAGAWHHVALSWDLATAGSGRGWLDDADVYAEPTFTNDTIDYTKSDHWVGSGAAGANPFAGRLGEYYETREYIDLDTESNRRKFISASGTPVDLGSNGSTPTGNQPIIYLSRRPGDTADAFLNNRGSGGGFTVTGALADGGTVAL